MHTVTNQKSKAFTLIEILVVVGIMAILAALSLGVFSRVRERGRSATCQSNLKQIALAVQQYTQDYNGQFPPYIYVVHKGSYPIGVRWFDVLQPYLKNTSVFWCPTSGLREKQEPSYSYNLFKLNDIFNKPKQPSTFIGSHESRISSSSDTILNQDTWALYADGVTINGDPIQASCGEHTEGTLHSGGANFSYVDGHVKWISAEQQGEMYCEYLKKRAAQE